MSASFGRWEAISKNEQFSCNHLPRTVYVQLNKVHSHEKARRELGKFL